MHHHRRTTAIRRGMTAAGAALLVFSFVTAVAPGATRSASAQAASFTVTADPTSDVLDGQAIDIRIDAPAGRTISFGSRARICRDGPTYTSSSDLLPFGPGNCPNAGVSSSATPGGVAAIDVLPDGRSAIGTLRVGTGRVVWGPASDADQFSLTCDTTSPCRLVVEIQTTAGTVVDASTLVTFADASAIGSCGGAAPGVLSSAGSDRFIDSWARWTREQCDADRTKASSNAILTGEGNGLEAFATGQADLAFSATGPTLPGRTLSTTRPSTSVPIALNAVVIGVLGGYYSESPDWPSGVPRPFSDVRVTPAEMAALFGQGFFGFSPQPDDATLGRNPQLASGVTFADPAMAPSGSEGTTFLATRWFDTVAGASWVTPRVPLDGIPALSPRGVEDELADADPAFPIAIANLYSARSNLKRSVASASLLSAGSYPVTFVLTDLATAEQLDIPVAALQNSRGEYVTPTRASLAAAVPSMERQADGTVLPTTGADAAGAYPLAFVEHVVAPTEPLLTAECTARADSQALLDGWLDYLTGAGQQALVGLQPLTPELAAIATTAKAKVGKTEVTRSCNGSGAPTPPTTPPLPEAVPPLPPAGGFGGVPGGSGFGSGGSVPSTSFDGAASLGGGAAGGGDPDAGPGAREAEPGASEDAADEAVASGPKLPPLLGISSLGGSSGVAALLGLALLGAGAGSLGTGRPVRARKDAA